jgi:hypothetical protein
MSDNISRTIPSQKRAATPLPIFPIPEALTDFRIENVTKECPAGLRILHDNPANRPFWGLTPFRE